MPGGEAANFTNRAANVVRISYGSSMPEDVFVSGQAATRRELTPSGDRGVSSLVALDRRDDGVALVTIDNPKMNALSSQVLSELKIVAQRLVDDPPSAVVIWGGERIFAAGADVRELGGTDAAFEISSNFFAALGAIESIPRVTIAAVNGYALGGGCELALACDLRVCADDARFGLPEVLLGVIPGGGGTQRLPRLIGKSRAKELIFSGRHVEADEALSIGLVNRVVPKSDVVAAALSWAGEFARGPLSAHALAKSAIDHGMDVGLSEGLLIERSRFAASCRTEDAAIGVASFLEHGPGKATFNRS